jgi:hypothetical protein
MAGLVEFQLLLDWLAKILIQVLVIFPDLITMDGYRTVFT